MGKEEFVIIGDVAQELIVVGGLSRRDSGIAIPSELRKKSG